MIELQVVSEGAADHGSVGLIIIAGERPGIGLDRMAPTAAALQPDIQPGPIVDDERWFFGRRCSDRHVSRHRRRSDQRKCDASGNKLVHHATPVISLG